MTVSVSDAEIKGSCMVTVKVVTPVFLSTETAIRLLNASAMLASSLVSLKGSSTPLPSASSSLNKEIVQPKTLKGAETIALHQGAR